MKTTNKWLKFIALVAVVLFLSYWLTYALTYFLCWSFMIAFNSQYVWGVWALLFVLRVDRYNR